MAGWEKETKIGMKALLIAIVCVAAVGGLAGCGEDGGAADARLSATTTTPSAPEFSLPSAYGGTVTLSALLNEREGAALVFYRGFF